MKRVTTITLLLFAGLTVGGLFLLRRARRTAPPRTAPHDPAAVRALSPVDRLQGCLKFDARTDYRLDPATKKKLRREERRQEPWEERN